MTDDLFHIIDDDKTPSGSSDPVRATIVLGLYVQPGAGRSTVVGRRQNALHVRVAPPPADGRANLAAEVLIADLFDVPRSAVSIIAGHKSREKRVRVEEVILEHVRAQLEKVTAKTPPGPAFNQGRIQPQR
ncbi:MAG TPA: DUF167 domain-containing protein [Acidimicrobiales bacterium]|nr:DUF167 domain-containing protein [Acidimicrobiales bacterium]